jgi:hypothetical protein
MRCGNGKRTERELGSILPDSGATDADPGRFERVRKTTAAERWIGWEPLQPACPHSERENPSNDDDTDGLTVSNESVDGQARARNPLFAEWESRCRRS